MSSLPGQTPATHDRCVGADHSQQPIGHRTPRGNGSILSKPADHTVSGFQSLACAALRQETWSFSLSLLTRSSAPVLSSALRFSRVARRASRPAASAASSAAPSSAVTSPTARRVTSPPSLDISPAITSTAGSFTRAITAGPLRRDRPAENRERVIGRHGPIDVEQSAHQGASAPPEQNAHGPAEDANQHPDQRAARRANEAEMVGALRDVQLTSRRALHDRRRLQPDPTVGVALLQHAQRLVGLARLREPNDHHVLLCHLPTPFARTSPTSRLS